MGYQRGFASPVSKLYKYYSDIASYPKKYPRYCKSIKIISKDTKNRMLTTKEHWRYTYVEKKNESKEKTIDIELLVRYKFKKPPKSKELLPTFHEAHRTKGAPIYFEILEGNPGNVYPYSGKTYFSHNNDRPELVSVHTECTGEMAFQHFCFWKSIDEILVKNNEGETRWQSSKVGDYIYEHDIENLEGQENRLDKPRVYREHVKITDFDDCFIARVTDKYPFKNPPDRYTVELISKDRRLHNYLELNRQQVRRIIHELERGLRDFERGRLDERNEMYITNDFVWLGYDEETKKAGSAAYLALYFGENAPRILIEFSSLDEVERLRRALKAAYDAW